MALASIGFLLGAVVTMISFLGGILYGGFITGDNRQSLFTDRDRIYNSDLSDSGVIKSDRPDIQDTDTEKKDKGEEA